MFKPEQPPSVIGVPTSRKRHYSPDPKNRDVHSAQSGHKEKVPCVAQSEDPESSVVECDRTKDDKRIGGKEQDRQPGRQSTSTESTQEDRPIDILASAAFYVLGAEQGPQRILRIADSKDELK